MFDVTEKYRKNGHFFYKKGQDLEKLSKKVPELAGVFCVYSLAHGRVRLVYIGASVAKNKSTYVQLETLNSLINSRIGSSESRLFFDQKMEKEDVEALDIYWWVTVDEYYEDLPTSVAGLMMQTHFDQNAKLPDWNIKF